MLDEAEEWLEKSESDLDDSIFNLENDRISPGVFFLQQSAEKSLKAAIIDVGEEPSFTHNLLELAEQANLPENKTKRFEELNKLYTGVRYPGEEIENIEDIEGLIKVVDEVLEWTKKQLDE